MRRRLPRTVRRSVEAFTSRLKHLSAEEAAVDDAVDAEAARDEQAATQEDAKDRAAIEAEIKAKEEAVARAVAATKKVRA